MANVTRVETDAPKPRRFPAQTLPRLESGDHLDADEFERRYQAMPHVRAELIEGVVYVASPVSNEHSDSHFDLGGWLYVYKVHTPGVSGGSDGTVRLDRENRPQPDLHLKILPSHGGRTTLSEDGFVVGGPEFIAEIAMSSASIDLHTKKETYRRNGVLEYLVWRPEDDSLEWSVLRDGRYQRLDPSADGIYRSESFPGLWLDSPALFRDQGAAVLRTLQRGINSPEHAGFVARLAEQAAAMSAPAPEATQH